MSSGKNEIVLDTRCNIRILFCGQANRAGRHQIGRGNVMSTAVRTLHSATAKKKQNKTQPSPAYLFSGLSNKR